MRGIRPGVVVPFLFLAIAGIFAALAVSLPARTAHAQLLSPGPLGKCHKDLEGDQHCKDCHSGGRKVDNDKCLACHTDLKARVDAKKGLHGTTLLGQDCGPCHVDHIGRDARIVRWPGGDKSKFDHATAGWTLTGKHAGLDCQKCHDKVSKAGLETFLGLSTACGTCHKDPHEGRFGAACEKCHDTADFHKVTMGEGGFDHSKTKFPLKGLHANVKCKDCHGDPPKWTGLAFAQCSDCHNDPHNGRFAPQPCSACHTEDGWKKTSFGKGNHPVLSLANGHAKVACGKCHDRGNDKPPTKGSTCVSCHANVHEAPFGNDCKKCHAEILWTGIPRQVSLDAHVQTAYPLKGKHVDVGCAKCHDPKKPAQQRFRQLAFDKCTRCHADRHGGEFLARGAGECAQCHAEDGFAPSKFGPAQHATTKFPLDGKHRAVPCGSCHARAAPRLDWRLDKRACADCHANPHGDQFAAQMAQGGCAQCHVTTAWAQAKFDHSTFPLLGAHARASCWRCHDA